MFNFHLTALNKPSRPFAQVLFGAVTDNLFIENNLVSTEPLLQGMSSNCLKAHNWATVLNVTSIQSTFQEYVYMSSIHRDFKPHFPQTLQYAQLILAKRQVMPEPQGKSTFRTARYQVLSSIRTILVGVSKVTQDAEGMAYMSMSFDGAIKFCFGVHIHEVLALSYAVDILCLYLP
ncbi:hypothetical protein C8R42DRAFT_637369 [Lentinula raphanica]|nr:hypothetical protein C8R42DRAFT_637369 [Lentinula raphanica]